jgi:hypothetical protein
MRKRQDFRLNPVLRHQQPTCQALVNFVQPIAGGNLLRLQGLQVSKTGQESLQHRKLRQKLVECICVDSRRIALDLYRYAS